MRKIAGLLVALMLAVAPAQGAISWLDASGSYTLTGAQLFALRDELPSELSESLKAIRNQTFADEAEFRAALDAALLTDALRTAWSERLLDLAATGGASFGLEPRNGGALTIIATGTDRALDADPFTSQSWLRSLPRAAQRTEFDTTIEGNCLAVASGRAQLFRLCQPTIGSDGSSILLETESTHVVGLGQQFQIPGDTTAERVGHLRTGINVMEGFNGGANGNTLFPIAYFDLPGAPFALVLDNRYGQDWDLTGSPYRLRVRGGDLRFHLIAGESLADIRRQFMEMAGTPPVPPKQMFGLWLSEYGYENWSELDARLDSLTAAGFPLSGVVLDLYWFGGINANSPMSRMGSLSWDRERFPDPEGKIAAYAERRIGMMLIEESYISSGLPEHEALAASKGLAHDATGAPLLTSEVGHWWGKGGMVDWFSTEGASFWHSHRRQPLIEMGVLGFWTHLGEPEMVNPSFLFGPNNLTEPQVRNSYNVQWAQSIFDGYRLNARDKRPFIMSRSGGIGLQSLGGAMWSGDTGSDYGSLAAQMPQQQHMMWSGLDYYGSDIGGFHRGALKSGTMDELYTQWFAYSALFEVPVRPHTENLCNCKQTAPDRIGDVASNLANIALRYELLPYYYSLAHRAHNDGEPIFPSLDYYFADDAAKGLGHVKMIGSELVGAAVATADATSVDIYLPAGDWYDFRTGALTPSTGETLTVPLRRNDLFELPLFARDGAIVPAANGVLRIFGAAQNSFTWFDDDGVSNDYQRRRFSQLDVAVDGDRLTLRRGRGDIQADTLIWTRATPATSVTVNGQSVTFSQEGSTLTLPLPAEDEVEIVVK